MGAAGLVRRSSGRLSIRLGVIGAQQRFAGECRHPLSKRAGHSRGSRMNRLRPLNRIARQRGGPGNPIEAMGGASLRHIE